MGQMRSSVLIVFIGMLLAIAIGLVVLWETRADEPETGMRATAQLLSPSGTAVGTARFTQGQSSVLVEVEASGLEPGAHALVIHAVGACEPDFSAAGDHFDPASGGRGFVHSNWNRRDGSLAGHGGDLPNIHAASDGTARADFFAAGVTLRSGEARSLFDSDGSSIIIHEKPVVYESEEEETGARQVCGVIRPG